MPFDVVFLVVCCSSRLEKTEFDPEVPDEIEMGRATRSLDIDVSAQSMKDAI